MSIFARALIAAAVATAIAATAAAMNELQAGGKKFKIHVRLGIAPVGGSCAPSTSS